MVPIKQRLDNDDHYDGGNTKEYIVMHDTGNSTDSDEGNANYFCTGSRQASAHYFVDNDSITQVVQDNDCSWHCGDGGNAYGIGNRNSIGIEMCRVNNSVTGTTEANAIELVKMLMAKYNIPASRVVRHYDASRKNCPSSFSANNWARWTSFKAKLTTATQPTPQPTGTIYRVRSSWDNIQSQKGAFTVLDNAIDCAKANSGYKVYDPSGVQAYPTVSTPAPQPSGISYGVVTADVLNVRSGQGTDYSVIGKLTEGDKVRLDQKFGDWWSIYFGEHGGFVHADYIQEV